MSHVKTPSRFDCFFRNNAPLIEETMSDVIVDNSQDKNEVILDESVTFCHPTPQVHKNTDTLLPQNTFTPAKKPESDMSTVKIEALISALKSYVSCEISMINTKLTSFSEHINKTISNLNHREDKHLVSLQDNISFLQKELLMENAIIKKLSRIKSLTETQTVVLDNVSTSQRMVTGKKNLPMHQKLQTILPLLLIIISNNNSNSSCINSNNNNSNNNSNNISNNICNNSSLSTTTNNNKSKITRKTNNFANN